MAQAKPEPKELTLRKTALPKIKDMLMHEQQLSRLQAILPPTIPAARLVEQTLSMCLKTPDLMECHPMSIWDGIKQAAELGLELSGPLGQAYLVPRWNSEFGCQMATFQVGYRGFANLAYRSSLVGCFRGVTVFENDEFEITLGTSPKIHHRPAKGERGKPIGYYAVVIYTNGGSDFEYMTHEEVLAHKAKYVKGKAPAWTTAFEAMAQKTPMRRLAKRLPISTQLQEAASLDEYHEEGVYTGSLPPPGLPEPMESRTEALAAALAGGSQPPPGDAFEGGPDPATD